jgi:predicted MFS family arabinose efflux permease
MVGAGETYLPAYALSVGMSEWLTGFFSTVPIIVGALIQMITPWGLAWVKSPKRWVLGAASFQAFAFIPLIYFSLNPNGNFLWLFIVAAVYWGAGFAVGPTWNFWMGNLVPRDVAPKFFSQRLQVSQIGIVLGLFGAGLALQADIHVGPFTSVFALIFFTAFVARASSTFFIFLKSELPFKSSGDQEIKRQVRKTRETIKGFWQNRAFKNFFISLFVFQITIYISSPFVAPYFLKKINMNYDQYMLAQAALLISKMVSFSIASKMMKKQSISKVFVWGAIGISPLPMLWFVSQSMWFVVFLQMVSGAFWSLYEVGLALTFFNQIKPEEKVTVLTIYNFFSSLAIILGSLLGGAILKQMDASVNSYYVVFTIASVLRLSGALMLARPRARI